MEHFQGKELKEYCSFLCGGKAKDIYLPEKEEEITALLHSFIREGKTFYVLGRGSNVLISDKGLQEPVLILRENFSGISFISYKDFLEKEAKQVFQKEKQWLPEGEAEEAVFTALSGTSLSELAEFAEKEGYSGLEELSGIPGTVGGAVKMNAGAYNREVKDCFLYGSFVNKSGEKVWLTLPEMDFSYRHSAVEDGMVCLSASFLLRKADSSFIRNKMEEYKRRRAEKQPLELPSAGSTFKRPEGDYASRLIEAAGLRGFRMGNAGVSEKHCGFVVNLGNADAENIYELIQEVKRIVKEKEGVQLETEVKLWGQF